VKRGSVKRKGERITWINTFKRFRGKTETCPFIGDGINTHVGRECVVEAFSTLLVSELLDKTGD